MFTGVDVYVNQKREYLKSYFEGSTANIADIIHKLDDNWIEAVYYTTSRSKREIYWNAIFDAYNANILDKISWDNVKMGSKEFEDVVKQVKNSNK